MQRSVAKAKRSQFDAFAVAVRQRTEPPFEDADPQARAPRFGASPAAVRLTFERRRAVVMGTTRDPELANRALADFWEVAGRSAAEDVGLEFSLTPAEVAIPGEEQERWLQHPRVGELAPSYDAGVPLTGEPHVRFDGWRTEPEALASLGGHRLAFHVNDVPDEERFEQLARAIEAMRTAGPELLESSTDPVFQYYRDMASGYSEEERQEYGIPAIERPQDVWRHVRLPQHANLSLSRGRYMHDGVAYVRLHCGCDWEPEHGLAIVFIDGARLGRVSSIDGHPTWAHAFAKEAMLDVVYPARR